MLSATRSTSLDAYKTPYVRVLHNICLPFASAMGLVWRSSCGRREALWLCRPSRGCNYCCSSICISTGYRRLNCDNRGKWCLCAWLPLPAYFVIAPSSRCLLQCIIFIAALSLYFFNFLYGHMIQWIRVVDFKMESKRMSLNQNSCDSIANFQI